MAGRGLAGSCIIASPPAKPGGAALTSPCAFHHRRDDFHRVALLGFSDFERNALGSCFRLALQRRRAHDAAGGQVGASHAPARHPGHAPAGAAAQPSGPGPAVAALLVDDSDLALRHLEQLLQRCGLRTQRASNSGQALALLAQRAYDFVFLDAELGDDSELDGLALCRYLKRDHPRRVGVRAPVVVMVTAHDREIDRVRGALAGCDAYFGTPLDDDRLQHVLRQHGVALPVAAAAARPAGAPVG
jgi:CheY-like chemotaxis protein